MKRPLLFAVMIACCFCWIGCADPEESIEEVPAEVGEKFRAGLAGRGEVVDLENQEDPFIQ